MNTLLTLNPNVSGVFSGPYPLGIDPVSTHSLIYEALVCGWQPHPEIVHYSSE